MDLIQIFAGRASNGDAVREELPVRKMGDGTCQLLASPGLASHVAKDDVIRVLSPEEPVEIVRRGRNVCVQIYSERRLDIEERQKIEDLFRSALPGSVDGDTDRNMCFSIPVQAGFPAIERFFNEMASRHPGISWFYGNVYADDGTTPLNWWVEDKNS